MKINHVNQECLDAKAHIEKCGCLTVSDKWKSLAVELVEALQHEINSCSYPKKVCSVCTHAEKILAKARAIFDDSTKREAGL